MNFITSSALNPTKRDSITTLKDEVISTPSSSLSSSSSSPEHLFFPGLPSLYYNSESTSSSSDTTPNSSRSNSQDPLFRKNRQSVSTSPTRFLSKLRKIFFKDDYDINRGSNKEGGTDRRARWSRNSSITVVENLFQEEKISSTTKKISSSLTSSSSKLELAIIFSLIFIVGFTNESATGASLASMQEFYSKSYETISLVFIFNIIGYILSCILSSFLSQHVGLQRSLVIAGATQSLAALILALAPSFPIFVASMFLLGLGSGLFDSLLTTAISHHSDKKPALMDWLYSAFALGAVLPPIIIGSLLDFKFNWNTFYWIPFGLTFLASLIAYPIFSNYTEPVDEVLDLPTSNTSIVTESAFRRIKRSLKLRIVWLGFLLIFIAFATTDTLSAWIVSFSIERNPETVIRSRYLLSSFWFGAAMGRIFLTILGKKIAEKTFSISLLLASAVGLSLLWTVKDFYSSSVALLVTGIFLGPITPRVLSSVTLRVPASLKGAVVSLTIGVGLIGASAGPLMFGTIANHGGLHTLPVVLMSLCLLAAVAWLAVPVKNIQEVTDQSVQEEEVGSAVVTSKDPEKDSR